VIANTLAARSEAMRVKMEKKKNTDIYLSIRGSDSGFLKFDDDKPQWDLLPMDVMERVVRVFMYGSKKYARNNWRKGAEWNRYYNAAMRHMVSWQSREDNDPESGLAHLDHALCSLIMLRGQILANIGKDDRHEARKD
jgi:hypothetical protein